LGEVSNFDIDKQKVGGFGSWFISDETVTGSSPFSFLTTFRSLTMHRLTTGLELILQIDLYPPQMRCRN
jgi:hypothetical protein